MFNTIIMKDKKAAHIMPKRDVPFFVSFIKVKCVPEVKV